MTLSRNQGKRVLAMAAGVGMSLLASSVNADTRFDPAERDEVAALVEELVEKGIDREWLEDAMRGANFEQGVLDAMEGAAERRLRWDEYREIFLQPERIERGVAFIDAHRDAFERAEAEYGVPAEIIAAIIGVETSYGRFAGRHRVIDSLSTLAFHHPSRGSFFRGELAAFLEITREQEVDPGTLTGSYAGAMGYPQFIPTSYRAYAVDFDGDGLRDLWHNPVDAIGSVANYFSEHGWQSGAPIVDEATGPESLPSEVEFNATRAPYAQLKDLGEQGIEPVDDMSLEARVMPLAFDYLADAEAEANGDGNVRYAYRLGHRNFYVITRYNHSHLYAMAVTELAEAIRAAQEDEQWQSDMS